MISPADMTYDFAALRFIEDENIAGRVYWYLAGFPVTAGEFVLAPVGSHNRLQLARVEKTLSAARSSAPYDPQLCKRVEAPYGARKLVVQRAVCFELGGVKYDEKHYTHFRRILFTAFAGELNAGERELLSSYGVTRVIAAGSAEEILPEGCTLITGKNAFRLAEEILEGVRRGAENGAAQYLR